MSTSVYIEKLTSFPTIKTQRDCSHKYSQESAWFWGISGCWLPSSHKSTLAATCSQPPRSAQGHKPFQRTRLWVLTITGGKVLGSDGSRLQKGHKQRRAPHCEASSRAPPPPLPGAWERTEQPPSQEAEGFPGW